MLNPCDQKWYEIIYIDRGMYEGTWWYNFITNKLNGSGSIERAKTNHKELVNKLNEELNDGSKS